MGPQITSRTPGVNATGVAVGANVDVIFDVAMAGGGFTTSTVTLTNPAGAQIAATVGWTALERRVRLNPSVNLTPNTTYRVTLIGGPTAIRSTTGVPLAGPTEWSFTTAPPPAPIRWAALVLFALTIIKAMLVDIAQLQQLYRIIVFFVLGILLLLVAWGYHKAFHSRE